MNRNLRRRAEQRLAELSPTTPTGEPELQRLLHELRVHQIELEMQNEELRSLKDAAEAASRAKSEFVANISHEVRTPLSVMLTLGQVLGQSVSPDLSELVERLNLAGRHLLAIIDDLLDLAKMEAGRLVLAETEFDPREVLYAVRDMLAEQAAAKGLRLEVDTTRLQPQQLLGDPLRLRQALLNYAGNAVKFTESGNIVLSAENVKDKAGKACLRFQVRDSGIGIDPATQLRLFHPFEQGDASPTRRHGGTGLGLHLVKRLAGLMGGEVGVVSVPERGSMFWFSAYLSKADAHAPHAAAAPSAAGTDAVQTAKRELRGRRVLLADDDALSRYASVLLLSELGLEIESADDGAQALLRFLAAPPDLVLMDLHMPVLDGIEVTRRIRALPEGQDVPIVALTASVSTQDRKVCLRVGMNDSMEKPLRLELVAEVLLRHMQRDAGQAR
ncbi:MAG: response regulator [Rhodocyclaceae bacterium]|nr:response regulator [Rhodocyclaceae bacterium]MBX3668591.1 response regulator [Rhodocyclaceae bacterium]